MAKQKKQEVHLYTDGSCKGSLGHGGYASIVKETNQIVCGNATETTNNKMELTAVIRGLAHLPEDSKVVVFSDSQYVINAFNKKWIPNWKRNGWKTASGQPVKNQDEWQQLIAEKERHSSVKFVWVKGHNGDEFNEIVDDIATAATRQLSKK